MNMVFLSTYETTRIWYIIITLSIGFIVILFAKLREWLITYKEMSKDDINDDENE
jgi:F0F1-type ATP synthase assembly protein I